MAAKRVAETIHYPVKIEESADLIENIKKKYLHVLKACNSFKKSISKKNDRNKYKTVKFRHLMSKYKKSESDTEG